MSFKAVAVGALCLFLTSGCASIFNGTSDTITVRSEVPGSKIYANNRYIGTQSAVFEAKKKDKYVITVEKAGCEANRVPVEKEFDPTSLLGILVDWGVISILAVDWGATGAINKAKQTNYLVNPLCNGKPPGTPINTSQTVGTPPDAPAQPPKADSDK